MASKIRLELVTPERLLVSEEVDEVIAPGHEGEFGVLPEHTQYLAILSAGVLRYRKGDEVRKVAVGGGFAEVASDQVVVLADVGKRRRRSTSIARGGPTNGPKKPSRTW